MRNVLPCHYETHEWDNTWIDHPYAETPRVLYIGDSISCGTRTKISQIADGKLWVDGFGTSRSLENSFFHKALDFFTEQLPGVDAVLFNFGLHGWHLEDHTTYVEQYEAMIQYLLRRYEGLPLYLVLTTYIQLEDLGPRVAPRNDEVIKLAEKYNLPVIDLYTTSKENTALQTEDGVHFTPEGYEKLAETVYEAIKDRLIHSEK